jgi:hypothetical protein
MPNVFYNFIVVREYANCIYADMGDKRHPICLLIVVSTLILSHVEKTHKKVSKCTWRICQEFFSVFSL